MGDLKRILEVSSLTAFIGGIAAAIIAPRVVKSRYARKAAVYAVAKGMQLQEDAMCAIEGIREDAQDIYHEARERAGRKAAVRPAKGQEAD
ncbi:MAG: DUF1490 domain-containing protein [Clostridiales Family XIII bacterium]|jgi:hypothetical protein|nr:DUF1490 domain-containing protein [Clostridiales Family XIII bacterium]